MGFRVVCISRTTGAEGERIGHTVAQSLGFRYVDEQIITKAAQQARVDPALVAAAEHQRPLLQRILEKIPSARDLAGPISLATGLPVDALSHSGGSRADPNDLRVLIRATIHEVAQAGQAVIVAHAASMALAGAQGVLRVLITASPETRSHRMAAAQNITEAAAASAVAASDRERREYFQRFYKIKDELPTHYDVIVNTDVLTAEHAVEAIVSAVRVET